MSVRGDAFGIRICNVVPIRLFNNRKSILSAYERQTACLACWRVKQ